MSKTPVFSVGANDCEWSTMTAGGPGGQHQNRSQTAVRCVHPPSGAVGVSREFKSQIQNKRAAFRRMAETRAFQVWAKLKVAELSGAPSLDQQVEDALAPRHIKIERRNHEGRWEIWADEGTVE